MNKKTSIDLYLCMHHVTESTNGYWLTCCRIHKLQLSLHCISLVSCI